MDVIQRKKIFKVRGNQLHSFVQMFKKAKTGTRFQILFTYLDERHLNRYYGLKLLTKEEKASDNWRLHEITVLSDHDYVRIHTYRRKKINSYKGISIYIIKPEPEPKDL